MADLNSYTFDYNNEHDPVTAKDLRVLRNMFRNDYYRGFSNIDQMAHAAPNPVDRNDLIAATRFNTQIFKQLGVNLTENDVRCTIENEDDPNSDIYETSLISDPYRDLNLDEVRKLAKMTIINGYPFCADEEKITHANKHAVFEALSMHIASSGLGAAQRAMDPNSQLPLYFVDPSKGEANATIIDYSNVDEAEIKNLNSQRKKFSFWKNILNKLFNAYSDEKAEIDDNNRRIDEKIEALTTKAGSRNIANNPDINTSANSLFSSYYSPSRNQSVQAESSVRSSERPVQRTVDPRQEVKSWGDPAAQTREERREILNKISEHAKNQKVTEEDVTYLKVCSKYLKEINQVRESTDFNKVMNEEMPELDRVLKITQAPETTYNKTASVGRVKN